MVSLLSLQENQVKKNSKFWFANEKKVLKELGFTPCPLSGAGELYKEDGYNEYALCQLKSTSKESYKLNLLDLQKLINNALTAHKLPVFIIEFLKESTWICIRPEDLEIYCKAYLGEQVKIKSLELAEPEKKKNKVIKAKTQVVIEEEKEKTIDDTFEERHKRKEKEKKKKEARSKWNMMHKQQNQ